MCQGSKHLCGTADTLYLVVSGRVKVLKLTTAIANWWRVVPVGRLFGQSGRIGDSPDEQAVALDSTQTMVWTCRANSSSERRRCLLNSTRQNANVYVDAMNEAPDSKGVRLRREGQPAGAGT